MALTDGNGSDMVMPVTPMYGGNGGFGNGFGGDWAWIILLLLLGWGNNGWGGNGFGGGNDLYPWMNQAELTNGGFRDQMINGNITSIRDSIASGFGDVQNSLCAGFAGVNASITNANMASMERSFGLQSQLAQCCCDNKSAIADLKYTVATENCADRYEAAQNTRDIIDSQTRSTQSILDKLCQLELDAKSDKIADLERQLTMANLQASQTAQTAFIQQGFANEVDALYNRLNTCPVPTTPVYGRTPIFTCNNNSGCGCACGGSF